MRFKWHQNRQVPGTVYDGFEKDVVKARIVLTASYDDGTSRWRLQEARDNGEWFTTGYVNCASVPEAISWGDSGGGVVETVYRLRGY